MSIYLEEYFNVPPSRIFSDYLSSEGHSALTGGAEAAVNPQRGESFSAWDGYITGKNLAIERPNRILQSWRTSEFEAHHADSLLEITLEEEGSGTKLCLTHTNCPEDQEDNYRQGWVDHYFTPMKAYYG
jgi:activator of HSP90 ATPase